MFTTFSLEMSTPSSIVGEQYKNWKLCSAEPILTLHSFLVGNLRGVFPGLDPHQRGAGGTVQLQEIGIS